MIVAIIPARGGSKRIPRKNIKPFCGKPMIAWAIEAAKAARCFEDIIVSTDDDEIAAVAKAYGAMVPFKRPDNLSDDHTGTIPVIKHAVEWYNEYIKPLDYACCIYATAPFLQPSDLKQGLTSAQNNDIDYAFSVTSYAFPIQRALRLSEDSRVSMFQPQYFNSRSQDLEEAWHDAGQFYWGRADAWISEKPLFSERSAAIVLPRHRVQDIDTPEDWTRAEWLFKAIQEG
ncbi:pseudaminic acid cytidylyltransferase [Marinobacter sp.]|uniref:pseudaminic acid cytidylyltransferase n=1 Tax=Marinobacter sp. TaxID=50741 RepID=UPI0026244319|nr:pseudaminic acid cytidylyltransferase [Marinobacter sp.]